MILFAVLNFVLSIACSFVQVHLFWLLDQCLDSMHWERYHQTDCPTSIFSTLLSSDTGKLVTSGWGDFWEVLFIFLPSCFTWFFSYCLILSIGFFLPLFAPNFPPISRDERHFSCVRHQRNEKSNLDLTLSDRLQSI